MKDKQIKKSRLQLKNKENYLFACWRSTWIKWLDAKILDVKIPVVCYRYNVTAGTYIYV